MKTKVLVAVAVVNFLQQTQGLIGHKGKQFVSRNEKERVAAIKEKIASSTDLNPETFWFDAAIDHYDIHGAGSATYPMRYLVDRTYFNKETGPILFYAGNEGDVWTFFDNTGFVTKTLAEEFGALVVFGEHRYFGESMPYGTDSFKRQNLKELTIEQAMFDYVDLIKMIKNEEGLQNRAVIVIGGSYGGMLAAWLRMKFPQWFQGALAASAPILNFSGYVDPYAYYNIATNDYAKADPNCPVTIKSGFDLLQQLSTDTTSYTSLQSIFNLCSVPTDSTSVASLINTLDSAFGSMVMVDYPYPTSFLEPLPAWPVNYSCEQASTALETHSEDPFAVLYAMAAAGSVFYNYAGQIDCLDTSSSQDQGIDQNGWNILYCNEMPMPFASSATSSMFPSYGWDPKGTEEWCTYAYSEKPQFNWIFDYFGGQNPSSDFLKLSNVVFSNGELDPWQAGGVTFELNSSTISLYIADSAHHLDLREPTEADPASLTAARQIEKEWIAKFIDQYQGTNFTTKVQEKQLTQ